jgi:PelA/Pel-15E family pectate lyase
MRKAMVLGVAMVVLPLQAAVIGMNVPVKPLTAERIRAEVPKAEQAAWLGYLQRSAEQMAADKAALAKEREGLGEVPGLPKQGSNGRAMKLHEAPAYYKTDEARRVGEIVLSFQTPAGGWSKNLLMDGPRLKGQSYVTGNLAPASAEGEEGKPADFDKPKDPGWHYVGTLDNDATNTELHFLVELSAAWPGHEGDVFRAGFLRGVEYLLHAQYPNGGWPQVWPLEGGYHDAVTFNDDAEVESAETLTRVAEGKAIESEDYSFVPETVRARAKAAVAKALDCVLKAQVRVAAAPPTSQKRDMGHPDSRGVLTVWAQQYDPLTLEPSSARNYEVPALSSGESASAMAYLMSLPKPSAAVMRAVEAADAWFEANKIMGYAFVGGRGTPGGRHLEKQDGAGPIWARYYSLNTGKPIFGDRDKTIHDDVAEISLERRNGYAWYSGGEAKVLEGYAGWVKGTK